MMPRRFALALLVCSLVAFAVACSSKAEAPAETPARIGETETPTAKPTTMHVDIKPMPYPPGIGSGLLVDVRIAAHPEEGGFNRIVFEFKVGTPSGWAEYVNKAQITSCGPGDPVPVAGTAYLMVHFDGGRGYDDNYQPTGAPSELKGPGPSILEAKKICDFEATLVWAICTSGERPYTVAVFENPPRVVIDVKNP